ncbi:MAG TPA: hypothetical protein VFW47_09080 [Phenylobacterium sp.]|nr:hypothetical protein [Phenylobacterium sp.]
MARPIIRILLGAVGVLAVLLALRIWVNPVAAGAALGVEGRGGLGLATLRADVAGFFGAAGALALAAAVRDDRRLVTAPLVMIGLALTGRLITVALGGLEPAQVPPIVVEAVLVVVLATGRKFLGAR